MKQPLRHLIIGTAVGVFSLGAYAQSTSMTPPPPTSPKMTTGTMSDGDYNAAKAACNAQTGAARSDCLRKNVLLLIERGDRHEIRNNGRALLRTLNFYVPPAYTKSGDELPRGRR